MAIQVRRGANADFYASKMLPGEFAVTTDGSRKAYVAFQANDVKELAFKDDIKVTAENIKTALGYTPADEEDVNELNEKIVQETGKLSGEIADKTDKKLFDLITNAKCTTMPITKEYKDFTRGFVSEKGNVTNNDTSTLGYTEQIPVQSGDVITATKDGITETKFRFITAFVNGIADASLGYADGIYTSYTVPDCVTSVVATIYAYDLPSASDPTVFVTRQETQTELSELSVVQNKLGAWQEKRDVMSDGESIMFPENNIKNGDVFAFSANIVGAFGSVVIGNWLTDTEEYHVKIAVDSENITIYDRSNLGGIAQAHGLTISGNIQVQIEKGASNYLKKVIVCSGGNRYECNNLANHYWVGDKGCPCFESIGATITNVSASYSSRNINKPIWLFGDSFFSFSNARWTHYLVQDGYDMSCLINGYAGEQSASALTGLENLLEIATPRYIVWMEGMNDADDGVVDASWFAVFEELKVICAEKKIDLVLATIPNAHANGKLRDNSYKNAIIKDSGYRYIDCYAAVGSTADGYWFDGMLDTDGVHPTQQGALALYYRILADFPEISANV